MLFAFLDESGKTGTQYYKNSQWSFYKQPYFGLGSIIIPSENCKQLTQEINQRIKLEKYQGEFKWSNKSARKIASHIIPDFCEIIKKNKGIILIEIEDKVFTFAKIITEYCVFPYYDTTTISHSRRKLACRLIANYLYEFLPPQIIGDICAFFDQNSKDTNLLKKHIQSICDNISNDFIISSCKETIDTIESVENGKFQLRIDNLFPIPNFYSSGVSQTCITPHIDCYNNILNRINEQFLNVDCCQCIHDNISDLKSALEIETKQYSKRTYSQIEFKINFVDSKEEIMISVIDFILGAVLKSTMDIVSKSESYESLNKCYAYLIHNCVNFISSFENQLLLFPGHYIPQNELLLFYNNFKKMEGQV